MRSVTASASDLSYLGRTAIPEVSLWSGAVSDSRPLTSICAERTAIPEVSCGATSDSRQINSTDAACPCLACNPNEYFKVEIAP